MSSISETPHQSSLSLTGRIWRNLPANPSIYQQAIDAQLDTDLANVFARRLSPDVDFSAIINPSLADLDSPWLLPDCEKAVNRIKSAIEKNELIVCVSDFDSDGINSTAVIKSALVGIMGHAESKFAAVTGQRLVEGYGLSDKLVDRMIAEVGVPAVVITADCGSSDEARISRLSAMGVDVIVTDHHVLPLSGTPVSAYAAVTPARSDSEYPDAKIAGCMVAWLLMKATAEKVGVNQQTLEHEINLLLDYVALATVADCVSLGDSKNNRAVVNAGLELINDDARPCWVALRRIAGVINTAITAETLSFQFAPRLNARGRLSDAMSGVDFLLADNLMLATEYAQLLDDENTARKLIEKEMCDKAMAEAEQINSDAVQIFVVYLDDGHPGVHGIVASRLTERFGKPAIMLSPTVGNNDERKVLSGSCRSIDGVNIREALQYVSDKSPDLFIKFGGHYFAAGLTTYEDRVEELRQLLQDAVTLQTGGKPLFPCIETDGDIASNHLCVDFIDNLALAGPYGNQFRFPIYEADFFVVSRRWVGLDKTHLLVTLQCKDGGNEFKGIWFKARSNEQGDIQLSIGELYRFAFSLSRNEYQGRVSCQLMLSDARNLA